jgi:hypothetical protein
MRLIPLLFFLRGQKIPGGGLCAGPANAAIPQAKKKRHIFSFDLRGLVSYGELCAGSASLP